MQEEVSPDLLGLDSLVPAPHLSTYLSIVLAPG
jgi:hypothetical protein